MADKFLGTDKGTVIRSIILALVWINVVLEQNGLNPIPVLNEEVVALALTFVVSIWTWFKNNYVTAKGQKQKEVLDQKGLTK